MAEKQPVPISDPAGRLDILLLRLAEAGTRWAETKLQSVVRIPVNLWDGPGGVGVVLEAKIDELGIPREKLNPATIAKGVGFIGKRVRGKLGKVG